MGMMLQVIWQLMHLLLVLCIIAIATVVPRSSGLTDPLSLESFSPISSIEAQVPNSILARGPLLNAPTVRPSIESPSINSPPVQQTNQGPLPFLSPRKLITPPPQHDLTTPTPTQATHDSAPPLSAKPTNYPTFPTARAPRDSSPAPVAEISVGLAPPLPVSEPPPDSTPPPNDDNSNNWSMAPTVSPHASAVSPKAKPPEAMPQLPTAEPPKTSSVASLARPPEVSQPTSTIRPPPIVEAPVISTPVPVVAPSHSSPQSPVTESPHNIPLPLAVKPPESKPPLSFAEPPQGLTLTPPPTEAPPLLPFPPPAMPPHISDMQSPPDPPNASASHASPAEVSQPTSTMQPPPISAAEAPVVSTQPPVANPPHSSALPLAAKPPESKPPLPVAEPPQITLTPNLPFLPPVPGNASSSPPYTYSPPPQSGLPHAPSPTFTVPSNPSLLPPSMAPPSQKPPTTSPSPSPPLPPDTLTPPPQLNPPIVSSPPPQLTPPVLSSPPPQLNPPNASSPPPEMNPPTASSPPPQPNPPIVSSPPHQLNPPNVSAPPPQSKPPVASSPPPEVKPPIVSAPPPQLNPPQISSPPPQMNPPLLSAPPPQLNPPIVSSPPPELNQPSVSSPPPELKLPIVSSPAPEMNPPSVTSSPPEVDPPNVMSPPPELNPPSVLSPPPKLNPPIISSPPPKLVPPTLSSPPQLIPPPASRPTSVVPPNSAVPPPLIVPPPKLSSPPPAVSPHASAMLSPPLPSHASPPLGQLVPPYASSPPYVLPTPPPLELPHISPPRSHIVPGSVPPHVSPPSPFLAPPFSLTSPVNPSHPLYAPPPIESSHSSAPPPVTRRTAPAAPPHPSQSEEPQERAPPPSPISSEPSPPSKTLPDGAPPAHQVTPRSHPPSSHQIEAPKRAPFLRSNASEPDMSPTSTPPRKTRISGRKSSTAPPGRAPEQSPRDNLSPNHDDPYKAPSKPRVERHNASAPAPFPSKVNPTHIGSNHSLHHSWVKGSPQAMAPIPSLPEIPEISSAPSPLPGMTPPDHYGTPFLSPKISPSGSSTRDKKKPLAPPIMSLPPPPPNADCEYLTCPEPFTNTPPGSPCGCVWPMQVGLRLSVALFTFFPLVSELAREVAAGLFMKDSQVRVMGANAASSQSEKTIVLVDLVPLNEKFDNVTSYMTFQRFWQKQVVIDKSIFGEYDVLYVRYPGLPPSPPMAPADMAVINGMPYSVRDPNQSKVHPLGVDVPKQRHKHRLNGIVIAAIVLSAIVGVLICCSVAWVLVLRHKTLDPQPAQTPRALPSISRLSGPTGNSTGSGPSSSLSIGSSLATYAGSAKTFSTNEIEKATDNLSPSRIIGEGGFGLVYSGVLEDETRVAVKVLKRDDQQGGREFLAEVEMLSRLHHRNLVKLIGICTDEHLRCLVYELIPNGSVDSHLHGTDKEIAPLDWASRMKIALGAARGLAYLHEDSSPRVIHRDFKSSNILLENDFTPKVSDFGLARSAMDEENKHISTRVMGTFGYVAPEYAMTGHLLVKSDVYSYGVVLLELLTGRKPVDMSQPPGQENIVAWTRPYLSTKEGLALILDPSIESDVHLDSVIKVAAIASMCVQPEVSHRPFMGEVVQALKLVCNECDDSKEGNSRPGSRENLSVDFEAKASPVSETQYLPTQFSHQNFLPVHDVEKGLSVSEIFSSARVDRQTSDSFGTRRHSASGPLKTVRGQQFWQRIGRRSNGSVSEHGIMYRLWAGSH